MARIQRGFLHPGRAVCDDRRFTRRHIAEFTGRQTGEMLEPFQVHALVPVLLKGYAKLEQATVRLHRLDKRVHAVADLKRETS